MAKVKKMAFGGMGVMGNMGARPMANRMGSMRPSNFGGGGLEGRVNQALANRPTPNGVPMPMGVGIGNATKNVAPPPPPNMAEAIKNTEMMKNAGFSNPGGTPTGQSAVNAAMQNAGTVNNMVGAAAGAGKPMKKGGSVKSSASSRGDGIAQRGKTKGRVV